MPSGPLAISVVINTLNEEENIAFALRSALPWASEIVVVDQESDDRTVSVAESFGVTVVSHPRTDSVVEVRRFAVEQAANDWVFILDADEMVSSALAESLKRIVAAGEADAVWVPRANYLLGRKMSGTGWGPAQDLQLRLFKKAAVQFPGRVHHDFEPSPGARTSRLSVESGEIIHFNYVSVDDFLDRLNRYTTSEAKVRKGPPVSRAHALYRGWKAFRGRYLRSGGKKDGWQGFYLSVLMAFYSFAIDAKHRERAENGTSEDVRRSYAKAAEQILAEYEPAEPAVT